MHNKMKMKLKTKKGKINTEIFLSNEKQKKLINYRQLKKKKCF